MSEKNIYQKISAAKKEMGKLSKDSKNPFFKSNYLSLNGLIDHIDPLLEKNGLVLLQPIQDGMVYSAITNIDNTEEKVHSSITLPDIADPQKLGSAITYYRRYTLQSLLGLQAEDDDGNNSKPAPKEDKPWLNKGTTEWTEALKYLNAGNPVSDIQKKYAISKDNLAELNQVK